MLISSSGPVARALRASCVTPPCSAAGDPGETARTGGMFVLNGHRSADVARVRDVSLESHEIRMRHNSVGNIDGEIIIWIACAALRDEDEIPRAVVGRARICIMRRGDKADHCRGEK